MPSKAALQISIEGDASDAVQAFDSVTSSARGMGDTVERASKQADDSASRLDSTADAADNVASRSSQAAGGLGDLGGALAGMGGPLGAVGTGMETLAPSIMGVTGAADLLNLATSSTIVQTTRARIAAVGHRAATIGQAVATRAAAVAQRLLNLAMRANPVGLLITGILLAVAAVTLLYRRSETFRKIVQVVFGLAKAYVTTYIAVISALVGWFADRLGPAVSKIAGVARTAASGAVDAFQRVVSKVGDIVTKVGDLIGKVRDTLGPAVSATKTVVVNAFDAMLTPVKTLVTWVKDLIDWISKIDIPNIPGFGRLVPGGTGRTATTSAVGGSSSSVVVQVTVTGFVGSEAQLADQIALALDRRAVRLGLTG